MCLRYEGCNFLRQRLVLATLSQKSIVISDIRADEEAPGLKDYEANFIRLLDRLTNGSKVEVNTTGTTLRYWPGVIEGGEMQHDCNVQRSIGYYIEPLIMLAPFSKYPFKLTLYGITHGPYDPSIDYYRYSCLPILKKLIPDGALDIKVCQKGMWPDGIGQVYFTSSVVRRVSPIWLENSGKVKRVRGLAYCFKANPSISRSMVDGARSVLNKYLPDVYITTECQQKSKSSGFGIVLQAESTELHVTHCAEKCSMSGTDSQGVVLPQDIGHSTAMALIEQIVQEGCVGSYIQCIVLLYMAMSDRDVSKVKLGPLTDYSVQFLRHMRDYFDLVYKLELCDNDQSVTVSCTGLGFMNIYKSTK